MCVCMCVCVYIYIYSFFPISMKERERERDWRKLTFRQMKSSLMERGKKPKYHANFEEC